MGCLSICSTQHLSIDIDNCCASVHETRAVIASWSTDTSTAFTILIYKFTFYMIVSLSVILTKTGHMLRSELGLKIHVQNLKGPKPSYFQRFSTTSQLNGRSTVMVHRLKLNSWDVFELVKTMRYAEAIGLDFLSTLRKRSHWFLCQRNKVAPHSECKWNHRH